MEAVIPAKAINVPATAGGISAADRDIVSLDLYYRKTFDSKGP